MVFTFYLHVVCRSLFFLPVFYIHLLVCVSLSPSVLCRPVAFSHWVLTHPSSFYLPSWLVLKGVMCLLFLRSVLVGLWLWCLGLSSPGGNNLVGCRSRRGMDSSQGRYERQVPCVHPEGAALGPVPCGLPGGLAATFSGGVALACSVGCAPFLIAVSSQVARQGVWVGVHGSEIRVLNRLFF